MPKVVTPRPNQAKPHKIIVSYADGKSDERFREDKDDADFEYNRGVSLVNRKAASKVEWITPEGKPYRKWG